MEPIGRRIKTLRGALEITQGAISKATGIKQPRLSKIEQGHDVPSAEAIDKIAVALQRSGLDLVKGTDREGYYRAQRLTAEQEALSRRETRLEAGV